MVDCPDVLSLPPPHSSLPALRFEAPVPSLVHLPECLAASRWRILPKKLKIGVIHTCGVEC